MTYPNSDGARETRSWRRTPEGRDGAYGYLALPRLQAQRLEARLRQVLHERAAEQGLLLRNVFVDYRDESPYAFAALRELLRRRGDVRALVLPDLTHVAHIATVGGLSQAGLARYLGVAVLVATPTSDPLRRSPPCDPFVDGMIALGRRRHGRSRLGTHPRGRGPACPGRRYGVTRETDGHDRGRAGGVGVDRAGDALVRD